MALDQSSLQAGLAQANAGLAAAQAKLDELMSGTRPEQLAIDQTAVTNAQESLDADIGTAYSAADDAIHNQADNLFQSPINNTPTFLVPTSNSQLQTNVQSERVAIGATLGSLVRGARRDELVPGPRLPRPRTTPSRRSSISGYDRTCGERRAFKLRAAPGDARGIQGEHCHGENGDWRGDHDADHRGSGLQSAEDQLTLAEAGSTPQDIEAQKAAVQQAEAQVTSAQVAVDHDRSYGAVRRGRAESHREDRDGRDARSSHAFAYE